MSWFEGSAIHRTRIHTLSKHSDQYRNSNIPCTFCVYTCMYLYCCKKNMTGALWKIPEPLCFSSKIFLSPVSFLKHCKELRRIAKELQKNCEEVQKIHQFSSDMEEVFIDLVITCSAGAIIWFLCEMIVQWALQITKHAQKKKCGPIKSKKKNPKRKDHW